MGKEALLIKLELACSKTEKLINDMAYPVKAEEFQAIVLSHVEMLRAQKLVKDEYNKENLSVDNKLALLGVKVNDIMKQVAALGKVATQSNFCVVIGSPSYRQHKKPPVPSFHDERTSELLHRVIK